jgi:hypothetical protein
MIRKLSLLLLLGSMNIFGQMSDSSFFLQFDAAPRWIWRGVAYSESPVLQPSFGYTGSKFTAFVWSSYNINKNEYHELDFAAEYKPIEQVKIGFTDYFGIQDSMKNKQRFFNFENKTTSHTLDLYTSIQPFKHIPLNFYWSTWFYGCDRDSKSHKQFYSSYLETRYEKDFKSFRLHSFVGGTPYKSFYYHKAGIVNVGLGITKQYALTHKLSMPFKIEFILNPSTENVYVNAVIGLR